MMAQVAESLTAKWETWIEVLALGFDLATVGIWGLNQQIKAYLSVSASQITLKIWKKNIQNIKKKCFNNFQKDREAEL